MMDQILLSIQPQFCLELTRTSFEQSLAEFLYHHSWRTSSGCFRAVGGGNLFLTPVSRTHHSSSVMLKCGDCAGQGRCWSSPSCSSNHDWTVLTLWMWALCSWNVSSLFGNNVCIMGCTWLPNLSTYSLTVIRPAPDYPTCPRTPLQ
jgi:hypothetical protein